MPISANLLLVLSKLMTVSIPMLFFTSNFFKSLNISYLCVTILSFSSLSYLLKVSSSHCSTKAGSNYLVVIKYK